MSSGRPKTESALELENILKNHEDQFVNDGKVVKPTNPIWAILYAKCSEKKKSDKANYTAALKWYDKTNKLKFAEKTIENAAEVENVSIETSFETSDTTLDVSNTSNDKSVKKNTKKMKIQISSKVWRTIAPVETSNSRKHEGSHKTGVRKYITLEPGLWTNVFANEISKHHDIPCKWIFKRNKCYQSGEKFLAVNAKCNACKASLVGVMRKKPDKDEHSNIDIVIHDINLEDHKKLTKNVKLTNRAARNLYLQNKNATVIRRNLLKETTEMFTALTNKIMTANAIRCAQYRERMTQKMSECPLQSLAFLKVSNLYMDCIQRIGLDPFFVFYCTPEQKKLFQAFLKRNEEYEVSCDASGGVTHKIGIILLIL